MTFVAVLLTFAAIDKDGWRDGLAYGAAFAGFRVLLHAFVVWNSREE